MKRTCRILIIILFSNFSAFCNTADSLKKYLNHTIGDEKRLQLLLAICEENRSYSYDTLTKYGNQAFLLSKKVGSKDQRILANYFVALQLYRGNNLDTVQHILNTSLAHLENLGKWKLTNKLNLLKASTLLKQNHHKAAINLFYKIIAEAENSKDSVSYLLALNGQGWVQMELGIFPIAKNWFFKAIASCTSEAVRRRSAIVYSNLASSCGALGQLDSAKIYVELAISLAQKYEDLSVEANGYNILSSYYMEKKDFALALSALQKSTKIRKIIGDPFFIISDMAQQSYLLAKSGKHKEAKEIIDEAIVFANKSKFESKLPMLYLVLSQNLYDAKDYKGTADALFALQEIQDSLYHKASVEELAEMQVKYESSKKEQIIQKQQFEIERKNYFLYGSLILTLLVVFLGIAVLRNRRHRQKVKMQKVILQQQDLATKSILAAEENERKRIASDLHDGLGQLLTAARFNLNGIADSLTGLSEPEKLVFDKAAGLVDESCREVRNVSHNIMPNALIKAGLGSAIKDFIDKIENKKLRVQLSTSGLNEKLDTNTEIVVYRIIQECVNNSIKHSSANRLDIALINDQDGLNITIEDNGQGFDINILKEEKGIGMKNIRTRTEYLKGTLDIDTREGKGTLIAIHVPKATAG